jgi:5-enolpyruvylshikimate-3-phosphate synthase
MIRRIIPPIHPLTGTASIPGDERLALSALALAMGSRSTVTIEYLPEEMTLAPFLAFLSSCGAVLDRGDDRLTIQGRPWPELVVVSDDVPDEILHQVVASAIFSGSMVTVSDSLGNRTELLEMICAVLETVGLDPSNVSHDDDGYTLKGTILSQPDCSLNAGSVFAMETVLAASRGSGQPVAVSYAPAIAARAVKLAILLGAAVEPIDEETAANRDRALDRRLARARGEKALKTVRIVWRGHISSRIVLPADMAIAAAIAGCALLVPRSRVTIRNVLWEQDSRGFFELLKRMKGMISWTGTTKNDLFETATVTVQWGPLEGIQVTAGQSAGMREDLLVLAAIAAVASGKTVASADHANRFSGRKEFSILTAGLHTMGARVGDYTGGLVVNGVQELRGASIDTAGEHGVALALAVASVAAAGESTLDGLPEPAPVLSAFLRIAGELTGSTISPE